MSTDGDNGGWQVREEESFVRAVAQLGGFLYVDEICELLDYHLHRNPLGFRQIPGYSGLYMAKTKLKIAGPEVIPACILWFRVDIERKEVCKLHIEIAAPETMAIAEDPWDEDEPPF